MKLPSAFFSSSRLRRAAALGAILAGGAALLSVTACRPQPPTAEAAASATTAPGPVENSSPDFLGHRRITIDFPGGTLGDLAARLPKPPAEPFNLIVPEDLRAAPLPQFSVRDADSSLLASSLSFVLRPQGVELTQMANPSPGGAAVYAAIKIADRSGTWGIRAFHLASEDLARMTGSIEAAWSLLPGGSQLRYHPETETLFVYGNGDALRAVDMAFESAGLSGRPEPQ